MVVDGKISARSSCKDLDSSGSVASPQIPELSEPDRDALVAGAAYAESQSTEESSLVHAYSGGRNLSGANGRFSVIDGSILGLVEKNSIKRAA
jgi:hypothetical protein